MIELEEIKISHTYCKASVRFSLDTVYIYIVLAHLHAIIAHAQCNEKLMRHRRLSLADQTSVSFASSMRLYSCKWSIYQKDWRNTLKSIKIHSYAGFHTNTATLFTIYAVCFLTFIGISFQRCFVWFRQILLLIDNIDCQSFDNRVSAHFFFTMGIIFEHTINLHIWKNLIFHSIQSKKWDQNRKILTFIDFFRRTMIAMMMIMN